MYNKLVLTMNNEIGKNRISKLNYTDYTLFFGDVILKEVNEKMVDKMPNISDKCKIGKRGCFSSYIRILQSIVDKKLNNVIILEDDLLQINDIPDNLGQEICYLNGLICPPKTTDMSIRFEYDLLETYNIKKGLNEIDYDRFKILGTLGIYLPSYQKTKIFLEKITECETYTSIDCLIAHKQLIKYFHFPAIFKHEDNNISNIRNKNKFKSKSHYFKNKLFIKKSSLKDSLKDELEILKNYKIKGNPHRLAVAGISKPSYIRERDGKKIPATPKSIKSQSFGLVRNCFVDRKNLVESLNNIKYPEVFNALKSIAFKVNPDFKYNSITINKNVEALPHRDKNNNSTSMIIGLGDFVGGGLYVETEDNQFKLHDIKYNPIYFNGFKKTHYTEKFTGDRFSIIFYLAGM